MSREVQGFCPMGCGATLFLGSGGYVTCSYLKCPNPSVVTDILAIRETEHIVEFGGETLSILHPVLEQLGGGVFRCGLHRRISALDGPPAKPGTYRVRMGVRLHWEAVAS